MPSHINADEMILDERTRPMDAIVELTKKLIRFRSVHSKPDEIRRCVDFVERDLKERGLNPTRLEHEGVSSIWVMPSYGKVSILLMSHLDVVEGPEEIFEPVVREGKLFGRGSIDDKYAAALSMVLMERHAARLKKEGLGADAATLGILITSDEEVGGHQGARKALEKIRADFCIALDGGNIGEVVVKEKGLLTLKLIACGKAAHGSRPWLGENAIEKLMEDYRKLKPFFPGGSEDHWHRTLSFNVVRGGSVFNQIPETAEALFDVRYTETDDVDRLYEAMRESVTGQLRILKKEPVFFSGSTPFIDRLLEVSPESRTAFEHGASDARFLSDFGIPGVVWGADGEHSAHSRDEHVVIASIQTLSDRLEAFVEKVRNP